MFSESNRTVLSKFALLTVLLLLFMLLLSPAFASSNPTPSPVPVPAGVDIIYPMWGQNTEIILMKDNLYKLGYYPSSVSSSSLGTSVVDEMTMAAIRRACTLNNLEYSDYGIIRSTWDAIMGNRLVSLVETVGPTSTPAPYDHIYYGTQSQAVLNIQLQLQNLGYHFDMTTGLYDLSLQEAIEEFCRFNFIRYDRTVDNGITIELQTVLFSENPIPFFTPIPEATPVPTSTPAVGKLESVRTYFMTPTDVLGLSVPQFIIWLLCIVLIIVCILLGIHFFVPVDENSLNPRSGEQTKKSSKANPTVGNGKIEFKIVFEGSTTTYRCDIPDVLQIGRSVGDFPLNPNDMRISRTHCEIYFSNQNLILKDCSSNGTVINDKCYLHTERVLTSGDVLKIGDHQITIIF